MQGRFPFSRQPAFSLIEMMLALGIFAFCIVVILGLLGSVMTSSRESWMETRSAHIARQIVDDLMPDPTADTNTTTQANGENGMLVKQPAAVQVPLFSPNLYTNSAFYSLEGIAVAQDATNVLFRADITILPVTMEAASGTLPARKVSQLNVDIRPVTQTNVPPFQFITRITPQFNTP
jgi:type II secretory pathway pseudopilin PulG